MVDLPQELLSRPQRAALISDLLVDTFPSVDEATMRSVAIWAGAFWGMSEKTVLGCWQTTYDTSRTEEACKAAAVCQAAA